MTSRVVIVLLAMALSISSMAGAGENNTLKTDEAGKVVVEDFTLPDYNGKMHSLGDYKDSTAIVLMFIATRCPVSNAYNERMAQLYADYQPRGIAFLGINSNKEEGVEEIKEHAMTKHLKFTILKDNHNVIADKLDATVTPEIYVLNPDFELLYHGRIDDSRREDKVTTQDLRTVLDDILAGRKVSISRTKAFGCTIKKI